jgi:hypothetical protein
VRTIQIQSVAEPVSDDPDVAMLAASLVSRGAFLGLLADLGASPTVVLDRQLLSHVLENLSDAGVARHTALLLQRARTPADYRTVLDLAMEQLEQSPMPQAAWPQMIEVLGEQTLAALLGISVSSVRRYAAQDRETPDDVAARLHFLALLVSDLSGSYNPIGIRRWFERARHALGGRAPGDLLGSTFDPAGPDAAALRSLANSLQAAGAT